MTTLAKTLDEKMALWGEETANRVSELVSEIIELADCDGLDILRSRLVQQEVLDLLDEKN